MFEYIDYIFTKRYIFHTMVEGTRIKSIHSEGILLEYKM